MATQSRETEGEKSQSKVPAQESPLKSPPTTSQPEAKSVETINSPSLEETQKWLSENLRAYAEVAFEDTLRRKEAISTYKVEHIEFNKCHVLLLETGKTEEKYTNLYLTGKYQYKFNLSEILDVKLSSEEKIGYIVTLTASRGAILRSGKIHKRLRDDDNSIKEDAWEMPLVAIDGVAVRFSNESLAQRVSSAFKHAIKLCKEGKEPF